jgi:hypothetical protein
MARQPLGGPGRLIFRLFTITHFLDTPHSVGLLWTRDQPVAETSTSQHSQETDIHAPGGTFFCLSGVFPLWSIFLLFKSFSSFMSLYVPCYRPYTTKNNTNIHAPGEIRTHDPSKGAAEDPRLRPRSHWDRLVTVLTTVNHAYLYYNRKLF